MKNKIFKLCVGFVMIFCFGFNFLFAENESDQNLSQQNSSAEKLSENQDEIQMENLSTTIKKEAHSLEDGTTGDFVEITPENIEILPSINSELPDLNKNDTKTKKSSTEDEFHYFEGNIGGGYPGIFLANFSFSRTVKSNYFSIDFAHDSVLGYGQKFVKDGFFNHDTAVDIGGNVNFTENVNLDYYGKYLAKEFGLQGKSPVFYSTNLQQGDVGAKSNWTINDNFALFADFDVKVAGWYANVLPVPQTALSSTNRVGFTPEIGFLANAGIFDCKFYANYNLEFANGSANYLLHRGNVDFDFNVKFEPFTVSGFVGFDFAKDKFFVPFTLEFDYSGFFEINVKGGLRANHSEIYKLQENYLVYSDFIPQERTEWFAKISGRVPIGDNIENNLSIEFFQSAFGGGIQSVNYKSVDVATGLYKTENLCGNFLNTEYSFDMYFSTSQLSVVWEAWWLACPSSISPQNIGVVYSYLGKNNFWGFSAWGKIGFMGDRTILGDSIPDIGASAYINVANIIKISLVLNDAVKLCSGQNRTLYGAYSKESGNVSLLFSFYL